MIYLINPSEERLLNNFGDRLPIGLLCIASNLQSKGYKTKVFDLNHTSTQDFMKSFYKDKPEVTGISVYTSPLVKESRELVKLLRGKTKLIAGGYHATAMPESLVDDFDLVIRGEGENMYKYFNMTGIKNIPSAGLDSYANLDYTFLDMNNYGMNQSGKRTGTLITSRGCFGNCVFCGKLENKIRFEPFEKVKEQIDDLKRNGFESLYFLDDIFTANKKRMQKITDYAKEQNLPFRVTTRADLVNENKMKILSNNGCEWVSLGIESGNDEILKKANKGMTTEQNFAAVYRAHQYKINVKGFFIIGLPGETEDTARQTINFSKELKEFGLKSADFYYLTPFPGTPIWKNPEKFGIEIINKDYTKYLEAGKEARCFINTKELKAERIEELVKEAKEIWKN